VQAAGSETVGGCVEEIGNFGSVRRKRRLGKEFVEESGVVATARFKEELFRGCAVVGHFVVAWEWICGWCQEVLFVTVTRNRSVRRDSVDGAKQVVPRGRIYALVQERDSWIVGGCRKSRLWMWHGHHRDQPEDETDCGHETGDWESGALGGSDLRCVVPPNFENP
jgi:hypothetical protein